MATKEDGVKTNGNLKIFLIIVALVGNAVTVGVFYGRTEARLEAIDERLTQITEKSIDDRYRGADAAKDFEVRDKRMDRLEDRIDKLVKDDK